MSHEEEYEPFEKDDYEETCICNERGEKHCSANVRAVLEIAVTQNDIILKLKGGSGGTPQQTPQVQEDQVSKAKLEEVEQQCRMKDKMISTQHQQLDKLQKQLNESRAETANAQGQILQMKEEMNQKPEKKNNIIQIGNGGGGDLDKLNMMAYESLNTDFISRAQFLKDMQNFDTFGARMQKEAQGDKEEQKFLTDNSIRQMLIDICYPMTDFIEFDKKDDHYNVRLDNQLKALQDEMFMSILALEHVMKLVTENCGDFINSKQIQLMGGIMKNLVNQLPVRATHLGQIGANRNTRDANQRLSSLRTKIQVKMYQEKHLFHVLAQKTPSDGNENASENKSIEILNNIEDLINQYNQYEGQSIGGKDSRVSVDEFNDF